MITEEMEGTNWLARSVVGYSDEYQVTISVAFFLADNHPRDE